MKKIITGLLVLFLLLVQIACTKETAPTNVPTPQAPPAVSCVGVPSISGMPGAEITFNAVVYVD